MNTLTHVCLCWYIATEDGEWTPVVVMNPEYRGPWQPRRIPNPAYRGPWQRPRIPHPDYRPDKYMYAFHTAYLGIDIWQAKAGTIFDDILITDDEDYADQYAEETYVKRKQAELEAKRRLDQEEEEALLAQWATL
jgi:calreticulin